MVNPADTLLVDRSERGKLALTGPEAKEFLHGQVTNDVEGLEPGSGCYAAFLTHKGKLERGLLSLLGPDARRIAGAEELPAEEHSHRAGEIAGVPVRLIATDLGVDVLCDAEHTEAVADALAAAGGGRGAAGGAEVRRVETGRPRYGVDLDDSVIPQEAGLNERAVSFEKGCYVGQETVARLYFRGKPNRHLRGLKLSGPAASGEPLRLGEREVGKLASVVESPRFGPIALALVRREAAPGDSLTVGDDGVRAEVVDLPFAQA